MIFSAPVMWQQISPAVGPSTPPSSSTAARLQHILERNSTMCNRVGSPRALNAFRFISLDTEMIIALISLNDEMWVRLQGLGSWRSGRAYGVGYGSGCESAGMRRRIVHHFWRATKPQTHSMIPKGHAPWRNP